VTISHSDGLLDRWRTCQTHHPGVYGHVEESIGCYDDARLLVTVIWLCQLLHHHVIELLSGLVYLDIICHMITQEFLACCEPCHSGSVPRILNVIHVPYLSDCWDCNVTQMNSRHTSANNCYISHSSVLPTSDLTVRLPRDKHYLI